GVSGDGKLSGIRHDSINPTSAFDNYVEYAAMASRHLWHASGGIATSHRIVHVNRNSPVVLRAPTRGAARFGWDRRTPEPDRAGYGDSDLYALAMARKGAGHNKWQRFGACRSRRARHRHWYLHCDG